MNQKYVILNLAFLCQECENVFLKTSSMFLSKAFEVIIAEKYLVQKNYLCNSIKVFSYIVTQILSIGALEMMLQHQTRSYMIPHSGKVNSLTRTL